MKTRLLKFLVTLVTITIVLSVLGGCAAPSAAPTATQPAATPLPAPVTINAWEFRGGALAEFNRNEALLFQKKYPWITVKITDFPDRTAHQNALNLAFKSGDAPDVFIRTRALPQTVADGWAQPIEPWITAEWKARYPAGTFVETSTMLDGKVYTTPAYATGAGRMLFINADLFRKAGLVDDKGNLRTPKTWSDLRQMAKQVAQAGKGEFYGMGLGIKAPRDLGYFFDWPAMAGASITPYDYDLRTGKFQYSTHPAYQQVIELLTGMKADGSVYPFESTIDDNNIYTFFAQGKFAIFMSGSYTVSNLRKDFPNFQNYTIVPLPIPDAGLSGNLYATPPTGVYMLSAKSKNPKEAFLWMDWLASRDYNQRMVGAASNFSIFPDLNTLENFKDPKVFLAYEASKAFGLYYPYPPARNPDAAQVAPDAIAPDVGDILVGIYTGQIKDWKQALVDLDARKAKSWEAAITKAQAAGAKVTWDDFIFPDWNPMQNYVTQPKSK